MKIPEFQYNETHFLIYLKLVSFKGTPYLFQATLLSLRHETKRYVIKLTADVYAKDRNKAKYVIKPWLNIRQKGNSTEILLLLPSGYLILGNKTGYCSNNC